MSSSPINSGSFLPQRADLPTGGAVIRLDRRHPLQGEGLRIRFGRADSWPTDAVKLRRLELPVMRKFLMAFIFSIPPRAECSWQ